MEIDQEILDEFHTEAEESLDTLEQDLIKLESVAEEGSSDPELVDRIFRVLHTLKGGAGFLGLEEMNRLAHVGENLLDEVRGGHVEVTTEVMNALLETNDKLKDLLDCSKQGSDSSSVDYSDLMVELERLSNPDNAASSTTAAAADVSTDTAITPSEEAQTVEAITPDETPEEAITQAQEPAEINAELLAEIQNDDRLGGDALETEKSPAEEPTEEAQESAQAADTAPVEVNQELLAEIQNDDRLGGDAPETKKSPAEQSPTEEPQEGAQATDAASVEVNQELLAEIQNDDRLGGAKADTTDQQEEATKKEGETPINQELLAEIQNDDRLGGNVDGKTGDEAAPEPAQKPATPAAPKANAGTGASTGAPAAKKAPNTPPRKDAEQKEVTIRVDTARLDAVMNLVGELVLARNGLHRQISREEVRQCLEGSSHLGSIDSGLEALTRVSKALQMSVLHTRMQPIKRVFDKIPRQVRELKNKLKKDVDLMVEGEGTEVDRSLVEELADPMVHLIRNALDHGLETPDERARMGKDKSGSLIVRSFYEGNNVVIQVSDDGRGIDAEIVKNKALEKGLITQDQAEQMTENQAQRLILAPGFSTAKEVSDVSGRGVGMDVVSNRISKMNGTIELESELGCGTTVSIYLPLTLAIVQALIVGSNNEGFAIPIGSISEVIKFNPDDVHQVNGEDVIELRKEVVPIRYLAELTRVGKKPLALLKQQLLQDVPTEQLAPEEADLTEDTSEETTKELTQTAPEKQEPKKKAPEGELGSRGYIIVVRDSNTIMGLVVDELLGQEEAVVKSITDAFEFNPAISGATISGDGHVHMILDVPYFMRETIKNKQMHV